MSYHLVKNPVQVGGGKLFIALVRGPALSNIQEFLRSVITLPGETLLCPVSECSTKYLAPVGGKALCLTLDGSQDP